MLEIKNVYKTFNAGTVNEKVALKGLDLTLEDGDFVTVIGGNGAGKSTMLNAVAGVWPVDMGKIIIDGKARTFIPFDTPKTGTRSLSSGVHIPQAGLRRRRGCSSNRASWRTNPAHSALPA